ncbi:MAG: transcription elongation factor GreA [Chloroflexi bacterium]|nr:transcription elongation factor GreA [Chloroflexota bacterium]
MTQRETYLTPDGLKQLKEELENLRNVRRREVAARIHRASETGGTVDNAEYDEAKSEQAFVEGRIRDLENIIAKAIVTPERRKKSRDIVEFGSSVTVENAQGRKQKYTVVGSAEAAPLEGKISNESPVGKALLGRKVGDQVEVQTPAGAQKLKITEIR